MREITNMTAEQYIKRHILLMAAKHDPDEIKIDGEITSANVDQLYDDLLVERDAHWDYVSEMRDGQEETGLPCEYSRHYESKSVASLIDGRWIGWTYWYGGGKHGEPEAIDWMDEAYFLDVTEEEKVVTVRTFTKQK